MEIPDEVRRIVAASQIMATDYKCFAEHEILGGSAYDFGLPWTPYALMTGTISVEEVNRKRSEREVHGVWSKMSKYFGFSGLVDVRFSLEPVNPETLETVRDPRIIQVRDLANNSRREMPESEWKDNKYIGPCARNL